MHELDNSDIKWTGMSASLLSGYGRSCGSSSCVPDVSLMILMN